MSESKDEKQARKEALKKLREARKETIALATLKMKEQRKAVDAVRRQLKKGGMTVPEIAEGAGISTSEAMWFIATLKKYGEVIEGEKDGGYFRYELAGAGAEPEPDSLDT